MTKDILEIFVRASEKMEILMIRILLDPEYLIYSLLNLVPPMIPYYEQINIDLSVGIYTLFLK